mmetsp:Transcript_23378/g.54104  ORF Transcript_23378/g.54104 Transcript_23378/m.54104 type:complete len:262 (+) Transcript_23378:381-1166(+)
MQSCNEMLGLLSLLLLHRQCRAVGLLERDRCVNAHYRQHRRQLIGSLKRTDGAAHPLERPVHHLDHVALNEASVTTSSCRTRILSPRAAADPLELGVGDGPRPDEPACAHHATRRPSAAVVGANEVDDILQIGYKLVDLLLHAHLDKDVGRHDRALADRCLALHDGHKGLPYLVLQLAHDNVLLDCSRDRVLEAIRCLQHVPFKFPISMHLKVIERHFGLDLALCVLQLRNDVDLAPFRTHPQALQLLLQLCDSQRVQVDF